MTERVVDLRCLDCGGEFASAEHHGAMGCPACDSTSIPANPRFDQDWTLSEWEWRVLATAMLIWAYVHPSTPGMQVCADRFWSRIFSEDAWKPTSLEDAADLPDVHIRTPEEATEKIFRCTPHEIRCLTIWASWAVNAGVEKKVAIDDAELEPILAKLRRQMVEPFPLTFEDEIAEIREQLPNSVVEVRYSDGDKAA